MDFIGRKEELNTLSNLYNEKGLDGAIVYGRRRFGKTTLIKKSSESFKGIFIYYQCLKAVDQINAQGLASLVKSSLNNVSISTKASFMDVIDYIFSRSVDTPILLVLDEYPYLINRPSIDTYIQSLMEKYKETSQLKLILSGSYVDIMEHLLDSRNPLHGRFRYKIKIDAFDYFDSASFYPQASNEDKVRYYSVFGGIPYYLSMLDTSKTFEENIISLILSRFAPLEDEINSTMKEEYSKIENASLVMDLIMRGKHSYSDIKKVFAELSPNSDLAYLLDQLVDMGYLSKTFPINNGSMRKAFYSISDNLFAFYFGLVYPYSAQKSILPDEVFFLTFIKDKLNDSFIPHCFEGICREYLVRKNKERRWNPPLLSIGSYTYNDAKRKKNGQFDLVSSDSKGNIFYECKFTNEKVGLSVFDEEERQLKDLNLEYYRLGFFSKAGFEKGRWSDDCLCFTLDDLYRKAE